MPRLGVTRAQQFAGVVALLVLASAIGLAIWLGTQRPALPSAKTAQAPPTPAPTVPFDPQPQSRLQAMAEKACKCARANSGEARDRCWRTFDADAGQSHARAKDAGCSPITYRFLELRKEQVVVSYDIVAGEQYAFCTWEEAIAAEERWRDLEGTEKLRDDRGQPFASERGRSLLRRLSRDAARGVSIPWQGSMGQCLGGFD